MSLISLKNTSPRIDCAWKLNIKYIISGVTSPKKWKNLPFSSSLVFRRPFSFSEVTGWKLPCWKPEYRSYLCLCRCTILLPCSDISLGFLSCALLVYCVRYCLQRQQYSSHDTGNNPSVYAKIMKTSHITKIYINWCGWIMNVSGQVMIKWNIFCKVQVPLHRGVINAGGWKWTFLRIRNVL